MAFLGGAFCGLILGGVFGLILGCCLASASKEDDYRELEYEYKVLRDKLYRGKK